MKKVHRKEASEKHWASEGMPAQEGEGKRKGRGGRKKKEGGGVLVDAGTGMGAVGGK